MLRRAILGISCLICFAVIHTTWSLPYNGSQKTEALIPSDSSVENTLANSKVRYRRSYNNDFDGNLYRVCDGGFAMYRVESHHNNRREDRQWRWSCRYVVPHYSPQTCRWTGYVNDYDDPMSFTCGSNEYISGVQSHHHNRHEDRRWNFYCCSSPGHTTSGCYQTPYVNNWDDPMDYAAPSGHVITGATSYHDNGRE